MLWNNTDIVNVKKKNMQGPGGFESLLLLLVLQDSDILLTGTLCPQALILVIVRLS